MATHAITMSHTDVEKLIYGVVWKFKARYGGDYEELLSIAHEAFMCAYQTYSPSHARFTTWLQIQVWRHLQRDLAHRIRHSRRHEYLSNDILDDAPASDGNERLRQLLFELSEDAQQVVNFIRCPPPDIKRSVRPGRRGSVARRALAEFLEDLGWATARIAETFKEIGEALG